MYFLGVSFASDGADYEEDSGEDEPMREEELTREEEPDEQVHSFFHS